MAIASIDLATVLASCPAERAAIAAMVMGVGVA
jgi:hypothetical protein